MTSDPMTIGPDATLGDAYVLMKKHGFRHVPIVENEVLVGIISLTDIGRQGATVAAILAKPLREVMVSNLITIGPEEGADVAAAKMAAKKINCLPVVTDGKLVGIVTTYDLLDVLARYLREGRA